MAKIVVVFLALLILPLPGVVLANKSLKIGLPGDLVSLDPHAELSTGMIQYSNWVFDPLVRCNKQMKFEPRLAIRWERMNDLSMRFYLRKGVRFHSGHLFTAEDVRWTFWRQKKSETFLRLFRNIEDIKIIDDHTIDIVTKTPNGLLLNSVSYLFPMDRRYYRGLDAQGHYKDAIDMDKPSFARQNESGTGAFKVILREKGEMTILERFDDYWDQQTAGNADRLILYPIKKSANRVEALFSGKVDVIFEVPIEKFKQIKTSAAAKLFLQAGDRIVVIQLNQSRRPEFKDVRVRQAMVYAINNKKICKKIMQGAGTVACQLSPSGYNGHVAELKPRYNLRKARSLMKKAGLENGFECTLIVPNGRYLQDIQIGETLVRMLAKINIKVRLKTLFNFEYWPAFDHRRADMQMIGWREGTLDSGGIFELLAMCPQKKSGDGLFNSGNYCNTQVDALIRQARSTLEPAVRSRILQKIERLLYADAAFVPLHWQNYAYAARKGIDLTPVLNLLNVPFLSDVFVD